MNSKQSADKQEWLSDVLYEIVSNNNLTDNFLRLERRSFIYTIGKSDFLQSRPIYINGCKITDVFLYLQHWVCNLLQKDLKCLAVEGKPVKIKRVRPFDNVHFCSLVFPLVIWKICQDESCLLIKGHMWVKKSTVMI